MTYFSSLSYEIRNLICLAMFFVSLAQLALCICKWTNSRNLRHCLADFVIFALLLPALSVLRTTEVNLPWIIVVLLFALIAVYAAIGLLRENKRAKSSLSPSSIKQALDNLNSGICFSDSSGRIVLINHTMNKLSAELTGESPQLLGDIADALGSADKIESSPELYRFPDGSIRRFQTAALSEPEGYYQTTAQDVSDLYKAGEGLRQENEQLRKTNEELSEMYERLSDRIREEETLSLKAQIHNDIGTSLISIMNIMSGDAEDDTELRLNRLQNAVSYFAEVRPRGAESFDDIRLKARDLGISLELEGELPSDKNKQSLIAAAASECVTNCFNHARGDRVKIYINENTVSITNNGKIPDGEVREGGGLSSLRKRFEGAGGRMQVISRPRFELVMVFGGK